MYPVVDLNTDAVSKKKILWNLAVWIKVCLLWHQAQQTSKERNHIETQIYAF